MAYDDLDDFINSHESDISKSDFEFNIQYAEDFEENENNDEYEEDGENNLYVNSFYEPFSFDINVNVDTQERSYTFTGSEKVGLVGMIGDIRPIQNTDHLYKHIKHLCKADYSHNIFPLTGTCLYWSPLFDEEDKWIEIPKWDDREKFAYKIRHNIKIAEGISAYTKIPYDNYYMHLAAVGIINLDDQEKINFPIKHILPYEYLQFLPDNDLGNGITGKEIKEKQKGFISELVDVCMGQFLIKRADELGVDVAEHSDKLYEWLLNTTVLLALHIDDTEIHIHKLSRKEPF